MNIIKNHQSLWIISALSALLWTSCRQSNSPSSQSPPLPVLGPMKIIPNDQGGQDTVFMKLPELALQDQDGFEFHSDSLHGQIRIVDFFFASCPGICIDMSANMARIFANQRRQAAQKTENSQGPGLRILSYTIDPQMDTRDGLSAYAQQHGVTKGDRTWLFLRGDENQIHALAEQYYLLSAGADSTAPGGFLHSGQFLLLDTRGRIRGLY
ncbi:MAG: SCO family protein, partial [Bacteroidota bacterium]